MKTVPLKSVAWINRAELPEWTPPDFTFRYVDIGAVTTGAVTLPAEQVSFGKAPSRARRLAPVGATVISTVRTYLRALSRVPEVGLVFSTGFAVLEARPHVDPRFLYYACLSEPFIAGVEARSTGVSYPAINPAALATMHVPLPALAEQRRIADFLDDQVARLDAASSEAHQAVDLLDEREQAALSELIGSLPGSSTRLGSLATVQSGVIVDSSRDDLGGRAYRYLRVANVQDGRLDLREVKTINLHPREAQRCLLRAGDVLMTEGGDLDKLGRGTVWRDEVTSCVHQNHVFAVRPDARRLLSDYLGLATRLPSARRYFRITARKTTNLASTNSSNIRDWRLPVPPLEVQWQIIAEAERQADFLSNVRNEARGLQVLLGDRRRALITAYVTGELDVTSASSLALRATGSED